MISLPFFFLAIFVFSVLTVAWVGFFFDELPFVWLALFNFIVFLSLGLIAIFARKPSRSRQRAVSHDDASEQKLSDENTEEDDTTPKTTHYSQHQQFVKYNYRHKKHKKHPLARILVSLGFVSAILLGLNRNSLTSVFTSSSLDQSLTWYAESILSGDNDITGTISSGLVIESTWEVLSTGLSTPSTTWISVDSSFVDTGLVDTGLVQENPVLGSSSLKFTDKQSVTLLEAVVYLLQTHDTPLLSKKDVRFSTVSTSNPYYKYWYTAFKKWLVGQTSSASSYVSCQTYFVLRGLLEKRDVQYTTATVKTQFWAEAQQRDLLNGCVFGKILKWANLD